MTPASPASEFTRPSGYGRPPSGALGRPSLALIGEVTDSCWEQPPWTDATGEPPPSPAGGFARHIALLQDYGAVRLWPMNEPAGATQSDDLASGGFPWKARCRETFEFGVPGPYPDATALLMTNGDQLPPTGVDPDTDTLWPCVPVTITAWVHCLEPPIAGGVIPPPPPEPPPPLGPLTHLAGGISMDGAGVPESISLRANTDKIQARFGAIGAQELQAPVTFGVWTLWVMTVDEGGTVSLYENGSLIGSQTVPDNLDWQMRPPLYPPFASYQIVYGPWSIILRALTAEEVAALV